MKIFFATGINSNDGPEYANRCFYDNWPPKDKVLTSQSQFRIIKLIKSIILSLWCDIVITTGASRITSLICMIARIRNKKIVGYCHGFLPYENEINNLKLSPSVLNKYINWLCSCDKLATNSELQRKFIIERVPLLENKVFVVPLGIDKIYGTTVMDYKKMDLIL